MNISIPVNSFTAFVGPTGSGKTTIIDIILKLISPQEGSLEIDGQKIDKITIVGHGSKILDMSHKIFIYLMIL